MKVVLTVKWQLQKEYWLFSCNRFMARDILCLQTTFTIVLCQQYFYLRTKLEISFEINL